MRHKDSTTLSLFSDLAHGAATSDTTGKRSGPRAKVAQVPLLSLERDLSDSHHIEDAVKRGAVMSRVRAARDAVEQKRWAALSVEDRMVDICAAVEGFEAALVELNAMPKSYVVTPLIIGMRQRIAVLLDSAESDESPFVL